LHGRDSRQADQPRTPAQNKKPPRRFLAPMGEGRYDVFALAADDGNKICPNG
jgi:hypothetical protein